MGSLDDAIDKNRQRMTQQDQAENAAAAERAVGARQAEDLIREATEKFAPLAALQLILVRPRKLFDRGKAIVSTIGEKPGTYTAVEAMRCWAVSSKLRYSHVVLTERGQLAQVDYVDRITINTESAMVVAESDLRTPDIRRAFTPSGDMTGRPNLYVIHLREALAAAFLEYERVTAERATAQRP
ncbi:hypothetical protein [Nocardia sp. MW-W600-9]